MNIVRRSVFRSSYRYDDIGNAINIWQVNGIWNTVYVRDSYLVLEY